LTTGTDRQISYYDASDCSVIRVINGSNSGSVEALSIDREGSYFVSGGADRIVKLWHYDEGCLQYTGVGHSGTITAVAISPDQKNIISVGNEGAIFIWKFPDVKKD